MLDTTLLMLAKFPPPIMGGPIEEPRAEGSDGRIKILVVDDEQLITDTICAILNENGFDASGAYNGPDAIAIARKIQPTIVLSDVLMPRMSGVELGIQLRKELPDIKVYLFSGQAATTAMIHRAEADGHFFELFPKPIHPDELIAKLRGF